MKKIQHKPAQEQQRMIIIDQNNFDQELLNAPGLTVVELWGPQCGVCLALMPDMERMAKEYQGKIRFCRLNVAEHRSLSISLRVTEVPTMLFYSQGECISSLSGQEVTLENIKTEIACIMEQDF